MGYALIKCRSRFLGILILAMFVLCQFRSERREEMMGSVKNMRSVFCLLSEFEDDHGYFPEGKTLFQGGGYTL